MDAAALRAFSEQSAAVGENLWGAVIRIGGGAEMAASITDPRGMPELVPGGERDQGELMVRVRVSEMPERPALQGRLEWRRPEEASWRPAKWRVAEVTRHECDAWWLLKCEPMN